MKFLFLIISLLLLIVGSIQQSSVLITSGACLYILVQIINLLVIVRYEKLIRKGVISVGKFNSGRAVLNQLSIFLELIILFCALIVFAFSPEWLRLGTAIISIGQILIWVLSGLLTKNIKYLPIRMGLGGWYIQHKVNKIIEPLIQS